MDASLSPSVVPFGAANRSRRSARVAGWTLVVLGLGHLLTVAVGSMNQDEATRDALDGLSKVRVGLPGPRPTLGELFDGYSLMMGAMVAALGLLLLVVSGRGLASRPEADAAGLLRPVLWLTGVVAAVGLVISSLLLPFPPLIGLGVTLVACIVGLAGPRR